MTYDGRGRLLSRHTPRQDTGRSNTYAYNADRTVLNNLSVSWEHADASRGSYAESYAGGSAARRELDPLGQEVGVENPFALYGGSHGAMMGSDLLYEEGGNPFDAGHGCALDGIAVPCSFAMERLNNGTAVVDTITTATIRRNSGEVESYSGRAGLPAGLRDVAMPEVVRNLSGLGDR